MPLSMASPTRCHPTTGAAAETAASTITTPIRRRRPSVYCHRRESPGRCVRALRGKCLVSEQPCERTPAAEELRRRPVFDDHAVLEHDGTVGDEDRREALARHEDRSALDRGSEVLHEVTLRLGVDR